MRPLEQRASLGASFYSGMWMVIGTTAWTATHLIFRMQGCRALSAPIATLSTLSHADGAGTVLVITMRLNLRGRILPPIRQVASAKRRAGWLDGVDHVESVTSQSGFGLPHG